MNPYLLQPAKELDVDEQIELVEAIWDGIVSRGAAPQLTLAQKTELERRHASPARLQIPTTSFRGLK